MPHRLGHTLRAVQQLLGMPRSTILRLVDAGVVVPQRGPAGEYRFAFQDIVVLRMARELRLQSRSPRRVAAGLSALGRELGGGAPIARQRVSAPAGRVAVRESSGMPPREVETGQFVLDFDAPPSPAAPAGRIEALPARRRSSAQDEAAAQIARGRALEAQDPAAALAAYREAIALAPSLLAGYLNLGALLCALGRPEQALLAYDDAIAQLACSGGEPAAQADLQFNRALALEDLGRHAAALGVYEALLEAAPGDADAHFNAARLCEALAMPQRAIRHYAAYRRLTR